MMTRRPVIGVTTQTLQAIDGIPEALPPSMVMNERYVHAVSAAGAVPWLVPLLDDDLDMLREVYDRLDGILVPGGVDMDPGQFGEAPHPKLGRIDPPRDRVELALVRWAVRDQKPVLGLCRGLQVINVALGGTLYQDLEAQRPEGIKHDYLPNLGYARDHLAHEVELAAGSRLRYAPDVARLTVNSMHHQGVRTLATALRVSATAPDGLIEAAESPNGHYLVGVQWHPEVFAMSDPGTRHLFHGFVAAAARYGAGSGR